MSKFCLPVFVAVVGQAKPRTSFHPVPVLIIRADAMYVLVPGTLFTARDVKVRASVSFELSHFMNNIVKGLGIEN